MSKLDYLKSVQKCSIDKKRIAEIEKIYSTNLNTLLSQIISYADKEDFIDDERRVLSFKEILKPEKYLEFNFAKKKLIPIIDAYDNIFIVYILDEDRWARFSISDSTLYKKRSTLKEVL